MKKMVFFLVSLLLAVNYQPKANLYAAEQLELLTYYPAPYGVYQNLKATQQVWIGTSGGLPLLGGTSLLQVGGIPLAGTYAIYGYNAASSAIYGVTNNAGSAGVWGENKVNGAGVLGTSSGNAGNAYGVFGWNDNWYGVYGLSTHSYGVFGDSTDANFAGVFGRSVNGYGVYGGSNTSRGVNGNSSKNAGVWGENSDNAGINNMDYVGVYAKSNYGPGIRALSTNYIAVYAGDWDKPGAGVLGLSGTGAGISGQSNSGPGVYGTSTSGYAGEFNGRVKMKIPNIPTFAGNAARDAAIPSPQEGDLCWVKAGATWGINVYADGAWRREH